MALFLQPPTAECVLCMTSSLGLFGEERSPDTPPSLGESQGDQKAHPRKPLLGAPPSQCLHPGLQSSCWAPGQPHLEERVPICCPGGKQCQPVCCSQVMTQDLVPMTAFTAGLVRDPGGHRSKTLALHRQLPDTPPKFLGAAHKPVY